MVRCKSYLRVIFSLCPRWVDNTSWRLVMAVNLYFQREFVSTRRHDLQLDYAIERTAVPRSGEYQVSVAAVIRTLNLKDSNQHEAVSRSIAPEGGSWPIVPSQHHHGKQPPAGESCLAGSRSGFRSQSARRSPRRHRPRCPGTAPSIRVWSDRAGAERPAGSSCVCRSMSPSSSAWNA